MSRIVTYQDPFLRGKTYYTRRTEHVDGLLISDAKKSLRVKSLADARDAVRLLRAAETQQGFAAATGQTIRRHTPKTFSDAAEAFLEAKNVQLDADSKHLKGLANLVTGYFVPNFGTKLLRDITKNDISAYLSKRAKGTARHQKPDGTIGIQPRPIAPVTVHGDLRRLREVFAFAVEEEWLDRNPAKGKLLDRRHKERVREHCQFLTAEEEQRLLRCASEKYPVEVTVKGRNTGGRVAGKSDNKPRLFEQTETPPFYLRSLIAVGLHTGMRLATIKQLEWGMLVKDGVRYRWRIPRRCFPKTDRDYAMPVSPIVVRELDRYREAVMALCEKRSLPVASVLGKNAKIFQQHVRQDGAWVAKPIERISKALKSAAQRAGIENLRFDSFRKIFWNRATEIGVDYGVTMDLAQHFQPSTVEGHYRSRTNMDAATAALDSLADKFGGSG